MLAKLLDGSDGSCTHERFGVPGSVCRCGHDARCSGLERNEGHQEWVVFLEMRS